MAITVTTGTLPLAIATAFSDASYKMYIYMEFTNAEANIPAFTTSSAITNFDSPLSYYSSLASTRNFLRVPAIRNPNVENTITATTGEATTIYLAQTNPETVAVLGGANAAFGATSICYGAALVLGRNDNDYTEDIVLARSYFTASGERLIKTSTSELFVTFPLTVGSEKATT